MVGAKPEGQARDIADSIMAAAACPEDKLAEAG